MITARNEVEARQIIARFEARATRHDVVHLGRKVAWRRFGDGPPFRARWIAWSAQGATWISAAFRSAASPRRGHISRLALLGAGAHGGVRRQAIDLVDWRLPNRLDMLAALRRNLVPFMLHDERNADALALAIHEWSCVQTRFRSKAIAQAGGLALALDQIAAPMLLMWGEHDVTAVPYEVALRLTRGHPNREFSVLHYAGHWAQYEKAEEVNALLLRWFSPSDRAASSEVWPKG